MKFADFVSTEAIRASLSAADKPGAIHELTQALSEAGRIKGTEVEGIVKAVKHLRSMSPLYDLHKEGIDISKIQWQAH